MRVNGRPGMDTSAIPGSAVVWPSAMTGSAPGCSNSTEALLSVRKEIRSEHMARSNAPTTAASARCTRMMTRTPTLAPSASRRPISAHPLAGVRVAGLRRVQGAQQSGQLLEHDHEQRQILGYLEHVPVGGQLADPGVHLVDEPLQQRLMEVQVGKTAHLVPAPCREPVNGRHSRPVGSQPPTMTSSCAANWASAP